MRLVRVLPILSFLLGASASSLDTRHPHAHPLDAHDVSDVCAYVNSDLEVLSEYKVLTDAGPLDLCYCLSQIPELIHTNQVAITAGFIAFKDKTAVPKALSELVMQNVPTNCNYPDNSDPMCVGEDPCGFTCTNGYTVSPSENPTDCVCEAPNMVCNGNCVAPGACPSSQAIVKKRWVGSGSCTEKGYGWAACGVFGRGSRAWECVNTASDLESCGGCVFPLTPFSQIGQDCTALPGVADVSCLSGDCVVHRCMPGYALSHDGTHCIPQAHIFRPHATMPEDDEDYLQAMRYGLEHRPL